MRLPVVYASQVTIKYRHHRVRISSNRFTHFRATWLIGRVRLRVCAPRILFGVIKSGPYLSEAREKIVQDNI